MGKVDKLMWALAQLLLLNLVAFAQGKRGLASKILSVKLFENRPTDGAFKGGKICNLLILKEKILAEGVGFEPAGLPN